MPNQKQLKQYRRLAPSILQRPLSITLASAPRRQPSRNAHAPPRTTHCRSWLRVGLRRPRQFVRGRSNQRKVNGLLLLLGRWTTLRSPAEGSNFQGNHRANDCLQLRFSTSAQPSTTRRPSYPGAVGCCVHTTFIPLHNRAVFTTDPRLVNVPIVPSSLHLGLDVNGVVIYRKFSQTISLPVFIYVISSGSMPEPSTRSMAWPRIISQRS